MTMHAQTIWIRRIMSAMQLGVGYSQDDLGRYAFAGDRCVSEPAIQSSVLGVLDTIEDLVKAGAIVERNGMYYLVARGA